MPALELKGCLEDSPKFRKRVNAHEETIQNFESSLKYLLKLTRSQVSLSEEYSLRQQELALGFVSFAQSQDDPIVAHALEKFGKTMLEVEKCRNMFNTHVASTFIDPLEKFVKETIIPVKDAKKRFEKCSDDVDAALAKYMSKKPKDPTIPESTAELADTRKTFHQVYMEYVQKLNDVEARKKVDYMENVLAYMYTKSAFHHQCYEILKDLESYMRDLTSLLHDSRQRYNEESIERNEYQRHHAQNTTPEFHPTQESKSLTCSYVPGAITKAGYLFERKGGRVLQTWTRKYYTIDGEEFRCTSRSLKQSKDDDQPASYNLRVCSVKLSESYERRFCFELITPSRIIVLQAENERDLLDWVRCIKLSSQMALNSDIAMPEPTSGTRTGGSDMLWNSGKSNFTSTNSKAEQLLLKSLREEPGNNICADCGDHRSEWASTNLGVIVCIECSGIHRSLGVHVSKIRSIALDKWEPEAIEVMLRLGNNAANKIFQASVPADMEAFRIHPMSSRTERDLWITEKYLKRTFVAPATDNTGLDKALWVAVSQGDLPDALNYLAQGANIDYKNPDSQSQTALHKAVDNGDEVSVEFLLQWSSDVNQIDVNGWTSLHYAAANNNVRLVLALLRRHAKADIRDKMGKTALDLAVDKQNVQAVTALRLFAFDKQHNSSPANSFDFGFREAMSSFKHGSPNEQPTRPSSVIDIHHPLAEPFSTEKKEMVVLAGDQNHSPLHQAGDL